MQKTHHWSNGAELQKPRRAAANGCSPHFLLVCTALQRPQLKTMDMSTELNELSLFVDVFFLFSMW